MRHGTPNRRSRNRNNNRGGKGGNNRTQVFDSNGPEVRIRGTAHQICDKYMTLAKDSRSVGDLVLAESYLQHAEHYQRIISTWNEQKAPVKQKTSHDEKTYDADGNKNKNNQEVKPKEDDLSLPVSILGDKVKHESEGVRAENKVLENA